MKLFKILKTIQLLLFAAIAGAGLYILFSNEKLYHLIGSDADVRLLSIILWLVLILSFVFLLLDFSGFHKLKQEFYTMSHARYSDPVSGIANRYSCDVLIEKYTDRPLPEDMGCIMFELTNITDINRSHGHAAGNRLIRDFSHILTRTSVDLCFVGRNGGNKFLAIFENSSPTEMNLLLDRVAHKMEQYNENTDHETALYQYGLSYNAQDHAASLTELIALANSRITSANQES